jgi:hypothetical protein
MAGSRRHADQMRDNRPRWARRPARPRAHYCLRQAIDVERHPERRHRHHQERHTADRDIVVALIDDTEATLKRLRKKGASIALEPANATYETRIFGPDRVKIQGRLAGLYRRYN